MPKVALHLLRSGRARDDYKGQWESYWSSVSETGTGGEVLWDSQDFDEFRETFADLSQECDENLPIVDIGCGNGSWTRHMAQRFSHAIGIDVAEAAVRIAREESTNITNIEFRAGDLVDPQIAKSLHDEFGDMNILLRTVFHVIRNKDRAQFVDNLALILGSKGTLYQLDTAGTVLDYMLDRPDDTSTTLPRQMEKVVSHGILPHGFSEKDRVRWFPDSKWDVLFSGEAKVHTVKLPDGNDGRVPAYAMVARVRA